MAVVGSVPAVTQHVGRIRYPDISGLMASSEGEIVEEPIESVVEEKVYVAVGKELKESKSTLLWALQNSGGKKLCLLHVLVPARMIPVNDCESTTYTLSDIYIYIYIYAYGYTYIKHTGVSMCIHPGINFDIKFVYQNLESLNMECLLTSLY